MTDLATLVERIGDAKAAAIAGLLVGLAFGVFAQRSRFCLRSAVSELARGRFGVAVARWALAFSAALALTQLAIVMGWLNVSSARQLAAVGSLSGAIVGGLMFGVGMIMARGCASRLLVLSATGNLRALVTGLILTVVAQTSYRGVLAPVREKIAGLWMVSGAERNLLAMTGGSSLSGAIFGFACLIVAFVIVRRSGLGRGAVITSLGVGLTVAAGWMVTHAIAQVSFVPSKVASVSFTGPSADTLMGLINTRSLPLTFDLGLVPGVFAGSALAALWAREFEVQEFGGELSMLRYIAGAALMGFGGMLAGGCAVGAGMSGGAIFALTSWVALAAMWAGGGLADLLLDRRGSGLSSRPGGRREDAGAPARLPS